PVRLFTMPTSRAGAAGIPWVYQMHWHACPCRFVRNKLAELEEGPGMPFVANRYPLSNPTQVFQSQCLARYDGFSHYGFADTVIHVLLEAALPSRVLP